MHCEADLPASDFDARETSDGSDADFSADESGGDRSADTDDPDRGWLDPDGLLDNVSTVGVGVVGGIVVGVVLTVVVLLPLPGGLPFAAGLVGWLAATAWIARTRSVFGAVRRAGYLVGGLLAVLPLVVGAFAPMAENTVGSRIGFAIVLCVFVWPLAGGAAVVGFLGGLGRPDAETD
jgi:hypothetical protein